ncbi:MAG TPA: aspartyl protease family protein [Longimicrobiales bacterium]|nr:aspartyl protease family protein [Longimicrobiales bacterium]
MKLRIVVPVVLVGSLGLGGAPGQSGDVPLPHPAPPRIPQAAPLRPLPEGFIVRDRQRYDAFEDGLRNGQLDWADRHGEDPPPLMDRLVQGLRQALDGRTRGARATFEPLSWDARDAGDDGLAGLAASAGVNLRFEAGDYAGVVAAAGADANDGLIAALATLRPQTLSEVEPVSDRLEVGPRGQAGLAVEVNGSPAVWWFDTGASLSVVSASAAARWGVRILEGAGPFRVSTATSLEARARLGEVDRLRVGAVVVGNHPVLVLDDRDLTFRLDDGTTVALEGILGWTVIRSMRTEIDFPGGRYDARLSRSAPGEARNLGWMGYPLVRLADGTGQPLLFGVDTGSRNTSITPNVLRKSELGALRLDTVRIGGVGGTVAEETRVAESLTLAFPEVLVTLSDVPTERTSGADDVLFFQVDGVLGIDVAQSGVLVVDPPRGRLELRAPGR